MKRRKALEDGGGNGKSGLALSGLRRLAASAQSADFILRFLQPT
jgi:hypothetical protein